MIEILADSPDDGALIARAIGSDTRVVNNSVRFANGGAAAREVHLRFLETAAAYG